ncbi:MAG: hypothetical protein D6776_09670 [Planctomycetota bacterium]|nr:MAG: hypothetical protein D6776_09670 [Planctomycetota bacterium]
MITIGLDIHPAAVTIAVLSGSRKKPRLLDLIVHRFGEDDDSGRRLDPLALATLIRGLFRRHKLPTDRVVASLPSTECLVRDLFVPFTRDDQIRKTVRFQAESVFQSVPIEELVIQYHKIAEYEGRSHLLVFGIRHDTLKRWLDMLQLAEIDPMQLDLDVGALVNTYLAADPQRGGRTLLADLSGAALRMAVLEDEQIRTMRALRLQAARIEPLRTDGSGEERRRPRTLDELREGLLSEERENTFFADDDEGGLPVVILDDDQADLFDLLGEGEESRQSVLEKVFVEIDRTLVRTPLDEAIEHVVLTGAGAAVEGIEEAFSEHFECPARRLALRKELVASLPPDKRRVAELEGANAVGLALKGTGIDHTGVDFRTGPFRYAGAFERLRSGIACTLMLAFLLFFLLGYRYKIVEAARLRQKLDDLHKYEQAIYEQLFAHEIAAGKSVPPPEEIATALLRRQRTMLRQGPADVPQITSALDMLRDLSLAAERDKDAFELLEASMRRRRAVVKLKAKSAQKVFELKKRFNERSTVAKIEQDPKLDPLEDGGVRAELVLQPRDDGKRTGRSRRIR